MKILSFNLFVFLFLSKLYGGQTEESIAKIPSSEKEVLACFCDFAIRLESTSHTLYFENKPVTLISFTQSEDADKDFREGWKVFKKYEYLFPHRNFIFSEIERNFTDFNVLHIFLINMKTLKNLLVKNNPIFQERLGVDFNPDEFVDRLASGSNFVELIKDDTVLLGILLGYGSESALVFEERKHKRLNSQSELTKIQRYTSKDRSDIEIYPIAFVGKPDSIEAKNITVIFSEELDKICEDFKDKNEDSLLYFLEGISS